MSLRRTAGDVISACFFHAIQSCGDWKLTLDLSGRPCRHSTPAGGSFAAAPAACNASAFYAGDRRPQMETAPSPTPYRRRSFRRRRCPARQSRDRLTRIRHHVVNEPRTSDERSTRPQRKRLHLFKIRRTSLMFDPELGPAAPVAVAAPPSLLRLTGVGSLRTPKTATRTFPVRAASPYFKKLTAHRIARHLGYATKYGSACANERRRSHKNEHHAIGPTRQPRSTPSRASERSIALQSKPPDPTHNTAPTTTSG